MAGPTVPVAIPALVAAFRASPDLAAPIAVRDGPVVTASSALDAVVVGWTGTEGDQRAVDVTDTIADLADASGQEEYSIRCAALSLRGGADPEAAITAARVSAYAMLAACAVVLKADRTLGGIVMHARVGSHSLDQGPYQDGLRAAVEFTVDVRAFTGR